MTAFAYLLIVVIPLSAFVTIALALRRGRPQPWQAWDTPRIRSRLAELDPTARGPSVEPGEARRERRERQRLQGELLRRGHRD